MIRRCVQKKKKKNNRERRRQAKQTKGNFWYLGFCSVRNTRRRDGKKKKRRKVEESKNIFGSVYKENKNTHTPKGWGHSQTAGEVQRGLAAMQEHLAQL